MGRTSRLFMVISVLKFVFLALSVILGLYLLGLLVLYFLQRRLQYFPTHQDFEGKGNSQFRPWRDKNGEFRGYYRPAARPRRLIVFFHGNGGEALDRSWMASMVKPDQVLFLAEYPGYGARGGKPLSEDLILRDAVQLTQWVKEQWSGLPVTVVGESLGSSVACFVASKVSVDRLGLISPFTSAVDVARRVYQYIPVQWLMRDRFESSRFLGSVSSSLHIVHGTLDEVVPVDLGRSLYEKYSGGQKAFSEVPGFSHNNINEALIHSPFAQGFVKFLNP